MPNRIKDDISSSHGSHSTRSNNTLEAQRRLSAEGEKDRDVDMNVASDIHERKEKNEEIKDVKDKKEKKKRKRRKNPKAPKQPMSAYNHFVKERVMYYKDFAADWAHKIIMKKVSEDWKKLADRTKYILLAKESK
mmetsp:Transcript_12810/g.11354  ORF Transcript_12810/g.11354 Transcript_12810/m.11354 type:complete len:135 (+) Transcript_12810:27-431(+)